MIINDIKNSLLSVDSIDLPSKLSNDDEIDLNRFLKAIGKKTYSEFHPASVLIPLVKESTTNCWNIILTKRAKNLKHHPGEISFPGGRFEDKDKCLTQTATRETFEEIGISPENVEILGKLPMQKTISGYLVTPFVGIIKQRQELEIDKNEVDTAFEIPLEFALAPRNHQRVQRQVAEQTFSFYEIQYNQYRIWGATARMLVNLSNLLLAKT